MADEERTIITKLVIEAAEAIASLETFDQRLEETKQQLSKIASETGESFGNIEEELMKAFGGDALKPLVEQLEQAGQSVRELQNVIGEGVKAKIFEGGEEEVRYIEERRKEIDSIKQRMQELAQVSDDSFKVINKSIQDFRMDKVKEEIEKANAAIRAFGDAPSLGDVEGKTRIRNRRSTTS